MSDTDSFIEEVTEEVRRDRLFAMVKRYGWIAVLVVLLIVGGTGWREYSRAQATAQAEKLGDDILAAMAQSDLEARASALSRVDVDHPGGAALIELLRGAVYVEAGQTDPAATALGDVATKPDLPAIYGQIATFKSLVLQVGQQPNDELRLQFEALAQPGAPLRMLAEEQLALLDVLDKRRDVAIERLQRMLEDAEATPDLQQRAARVIVALGGTPEVPGAQDG